MFTEKFVSLKCILGEFHLSARLENVTEFHPNKIAFTRFLTMFQTCCSFHNCNRYAFPLKKQTYSQFSEGEIQYSIFPCGR